MTQSHIVALSGGKDSTAMALRLAEIEPRDYTYICTPTGDELPTMFAHWRNLATILGKPIIPICKDTLHHLIKRQNALPNWRQRWCTRLLKIEPYADYLALHAPATSYVGLRSDEPEREGGDYLAIPGIQQDFPLRRWGWTITDVTDYLHHRQITVPPRTDCSLCFFQRLIQWWELWHDHPDEWATGVALESLTGHTFRSPSRDTWPASLAELARLFNDGHKPPDTRDRLQTLQCRVCRL